MKAFEHASERCHTPAEQAVLVSGTLDRSLEARPVRTDGESRMTSTTGEPGGPPAGGGDFRVWFRPKRDRRLPSLVELSAAALGPEGVTTIAQFLGVERPAAAGAVAATLLLVSGRLADKARTGGTHGLTVVLRQMDSWSAGGLPDSLLGPQIPSGLAILSPLFGEDLTGAVQALSRARGLAPRQSVALLGLLTCVVLGALARVRRQQRLATGEVGHLLAHQRFHGVPVIDLAAPLQAIRARDPRSAEAWQVLEEHLLGDHD
jgi:hypothetical protein